jgi:hypothetical protein
MTIDPDTPVYALVIGRNYADEEMKPYISGLREAYAPFVDAITPVNLNQGFEVREGEPPKAVFLARWRSKADFDAFWTSEKYEELKKRRAGVGDFTVILLPDMGAAFGGGAA